MTFASTDLGLFDDCDQSAFPSSVSRLFVNTSATSNPVAFEQILGNNNSNSINVNNNSYSFPSNDLATMSWDMTPSKLQLQQLFNSNVSSVNADNVMDFTPELSPAMSLVTPAPNSLQSPATFDNLGLDELGSSPCADWHSSPMDNNQTFGYSSSQQSQESFDFDFGLDLISHQQNNTRSWPVQTRDFDLFPENGSISSLEQLLMKFNGTTVGAITNENGEQMSYFESPFESDLDYFSPLDSCAASPILSDDVNLFCKIEETNPTVTCVSPSAAGSASATGETSGFQPPKRRRRRRATTEEESRVTSNDDPEGRARYMCSVCNKTFSRPFNLRSHRATHAGVKPFNCPHVNEKGETCTWTFARRHDMERHVRSRHSGEKLFKCKTCGSECGRNDAFRRHLQRHPVCGLAAMMEQKQLEQQNGA
ncbi:hypothetical protein BGZ46_004779 [Entomortierella lignicola]|nr:hypothetical protein BGZ46_004779 [Entomortierella lignicola]